MSHPRTQLSRLSHTAAIALAAGGLLGAGYIAGDNPGPATNTLHQMEATEILGYPIVQAYLQSVNTAITERLEAVGGGSITMADVDPIVDDIVTKSREFFDDHELVTLNTTQWKNKTGGALIPAEPTSATTKTLHSFLSTAVVESLEEGTRARMDALLGLLAESGEKVQGQTIFGIALDGVGGASSDIECWECIWNTASPDGRWFNVCTGAWGGPS